LSHANPIYLLLLAAALHIVLALAVLGAGKLQLFPAGISPNGLSDALGRDSALYFQPQVEMIADLLHQGEVSAWLHRPADLHVKLYSLSFALFSRWTTFNVLTVEPLNLFYYLAILILIFQLACLLFDSRAGLVAAMIVALWPSFLLHTTQLLRDPLLIVATLTLMLCATRWLTLTKSWRQSWPFALLAVFAAATIWLVRGGMGYMVPLILVLTLLLLVARQLREKRLLLVNLSCVLLVLLTATFLPRALPSSRSKLTQVNPDAPMMWQRIAATRQRAIETSPDPGSNIDADVQFNGPVDLVRYAPRAIIIGLFAPFPSMWSAVGQHVGKLGKLLADFETLLIYFMELLCVVGIWQRRRLFAPWLLLFTAVVGGGAIAMVMVNVGTIYRLRYSFWMLIVVLGSGALVRLLSKVSKKEKAEIKGAAGL
jgi:putative peptidoglycan lipid II flippase